MKKLILLLAGIICLAAEAQKPSISPGWDLVQVKDGVWVDARETTYADWYNFMFSAGITISDDSVAALLPDSTKLPPAFRALVRTMLNNIHGETDCEGKYYETQLMSPKIYRKGQPMEFAPVLSCVKKLDPLWDYPVTALGYPQVLAYIQWRNELIEEQVLSKDGPEKWVCRLPSAAEWAEVARVSFEKAVTGLPPERVAELTKVYQQDGRNNKGCLLVGIRNDNPCESDKGYAAKFSMAGLFPSTAFFPNSLSIYTLQGNVSEMTSTQGVAAGGNFTLGMDQALFNATQNYTAPEFWLGFRCVAEKVTISY